MEIGTSSNNKILLIIVSIVVLIIIGVVIYQKNAEPEKETQSNISTTQPTDMKKTETSTCLSPLTSPTQGAGTSSGLICSGGGIAYSGRNGIDGADGANGSNGSSGSNGRDGTNGSNGADGATGPQGPAGPAGPPGPAYTPSPTPTPTSTEEDDGGYYQSFDENSTPKSTTGPSPVYLDAEIYTNISAELSLSVDYATVVLTTLGNGAGNFLDGVTGGIITGSHIWTVGCNNSSGYELKLKQMTGAKDAPNGGPNGSLSHTTDGANFYFTAMPGSGTPQSSWTAPAAGTGYFGYSITATTSTLASGWTLGYWNAVTTSDVLLLDKVTASAEAGDTANILWKAEWTTSGSQYLKTGTYNEFVTLTANTQ